MAHHAQIYDKTAYVISQMAYIGPGIWRWLLCPVCDRV